MKFKDIIEGINKYFKVKFPENKGWFIGRDFIENTEINIYKTYTIELYYHLGNNNIKILSYTKTDRCLTGEEDRFKDKTYSEVLAKIIENKEVIDSYGV